VPTRDSSYYWSLRIERYSGRQGMKSNLQSSLSRCDTPVSNDEGLYFVDPNKRSQSGVCLIAVSVGTWDGERLVDWPVLSEGIVRPCFDFGGRLR
jgi:hypothetical protein